MNLLHRRSAWLVLAGLVYLLTVSLAVTARAAGVTQAPKITANILVSSGVTVGPYLTGDGTVGSPLTVDVGALSAALTPVIVSSAVPTGLIVVSTQPFCPDGWNNFTSADGYFLVPVVAARAPGQTFGTAISAFTENQAYTISNSPVNVPNGTDQTVGDQFSETLNRGDIVPGFYVRLCIKA